MGRWSAAIAFGYLLIASCAAWEVAAQNPVPPGASSAHELYVAGKAAEARGDHAEMARLWRALAELGDRRGQNNLGVAYNAGLGISEDPVEAAKWFRLSAEQGEATGQFNLARALFFWRGVATDQKEAVLWLRKSANQGLAVAQHGFSTVLATGRGVERNSTEAIALLRRAAAQNYTPSVRNLELLRIGGSQADPDEAEFLYRYAMANTSDGVFGIGGWSAYACCGRRPR